MSDKFLSFEVRIQRGNQDPVTITAVTTADAARAALATVVSEYVQAVNGVDAKLGLIGKAAYSVSVDDDHVLVVRTATLDAVEFHVATRVVPQEATKNELRLWAEREVSAHGQGQQR